MIFYPWRTSSRLWKSSWRSWKFSLTCGRIQFGHSVYHMCKSRSTLHRHRFAAVRVSIPSVLRYLHIRDIGQAQTFPRGVPQSGLAPETKDEGIRPTSIYIQGSGLFTMSCEQWLPFCLCYFNKVLLASCNFISTCNALWEMLSKIRKTLPNTALF